LPDSYYVTVRDDLWAVLCSAPAEVATLRAALLAGHVDGTVYEGDCSCLVGTLANARGCNYLDIPGLAPDSSRPAEAWFLQIKKGNTPTGNDFSKRAVEWIDQWLANMRGTSSVSAVAAGDAARAA
jgi:hypothetical protein